MFQVIADNKRGKFRLDALFTHAGTAKCALVYNLWFGWSISVLAVRMGLHKLDTLAVRCLSHSHALKSVFWAMSLLPGLDLLDSTCKLIFHNPNATASMAGRRCGFGT